MTSDPERNIEKSLRAYAERRRAQAGEPFELSGSARNRLLRESARLRWGFKPDGGFWSWLLGEKELMVGFAAMVLVALGVGVYGFREYARNDLNLASNGKLDLVRELANEPTSRQMKRADKDQSVDNSPASASVAAPAIAAAAPPPGTPAPATTPRPEQPALAEKRVAKVADRQLGSAPSSQPQPMPKKEEKISEEALAQWTFKARTEAPTTKTAKNPVSPESFGLSNPPAGAAKETLLAAAPPAKPENKGFISLGDSKPIGTEFNLSSRFGTEDAGATDGAITGGDSLKVGGAAPAKAPTSAVLTFVPTENSSSITQQFAQATSENRTDSGPKSGILRTFRMELNGNKVRFVDADGSAFSGFLQKADLTRDGGSTATTTGTLTPPKESAPEDGSGTTTYFFRATGTILSLGKRALFSGTYNPAITAQSGMPVAAGGAKGAAPSPAPAKISGVVVLEDGSLKVPVNATPASH